MAYVIEEKPVAVDLPDLPLRGVDKQGRGLTLRLATEEDHPRLFEIFEPILEDGQAYPQYPPMDLEGFKAYYCSSVVLVCEAEQGGVVGSVYVKPNFPGRCSHICNGGFIVAESERGNGVGWFLAKHFCKYAKALGYKAVMFNLVFVTNKASIHMWDKLGFTRLGVLPKAGNLKGSEELVDAYMYHKDLEAYDPAQDPNLQ